MNRKKKIVLGLGIIVLLPILWWFVFGGGVVARQIFLYKYFDVEPPGDRSHHLRMTKEEVEEWKKKQDLQENTND